jgi:hypothetical protein
VFVPNNRTVGMIERAAAAPAAKGDTK